MRWNKSTPRNGQSRYISRFLIFPLKLNGETRWMERAEIRQVYRVGAYVTDDNGWISTNFKL